MTQTNIDNWGVIGENINKSNIKRINWKELLGITLTERITELNIKGLDSDQIFKVINNELIRNNEWTYEISRKLRISVSARCGEQQAYNNRGKKK